LSTEVKKVFFVCENLMQNIIYYERSYQKIFLGSRALRIISQSEDLCFPRIIFFLSLF